jgi:RsiW-degrading membrane proteinase PrsW (M82 family)
MDQATILLPILGGFLPTLIWLWYWTREDTLHPEPKRLILLAFLAGGISIAIAIPLQFQARADILSAGITNYKYGFPIILSWAAIEEILKFLVLFFVILWRKAVDEPIDPLIYIISIALGFSAVENTLFVLSEQIKHAPLLTTITMGGFRFFGATLLHVLSSSIIGIALSFSFHKRLIKRIIYTSIAISLSIIIHTTFNMFILHTQGINVIKIFTVVWVGIVLLLLFFEKIKQIPIITKK